MTIFLKTNLKNVPFQFGVEKRAITLTENLHNENTSLSPKYILGGIAYEFSGIELTEIFGKKFTQERTYHKKSWFSTNVFLCIFLDKHQLDVINKVTMTLDRPSM